MSRMAKMMDVHSIKELKLWARLTCFSFQWCLVHLEGVIINYLVKC